MTNAKRIASLVLVICIMLTMPAAVLQATAAEITSALSIGNLATGSADALKEIESAITSGTKDSSGIYYAFQLPSVVKLGSDTMGTEEYTLMAASALYALNEGETNETLIGYQNVTFKTNNAVCGSGTTLTKGQYLDLAMRAHDYGTTLSALPSSFNRPTDGTNAYDGRICVYSLAHIFAKALASYAANGKLPESITFLPTHPTDVSFVDPTEPSSAAPSSSSSASTTASTTKATTASTTKATTASTTKATSASSSATASSKNSLASVALEAYQVEQWVLTNKTLPNYCTLDNGNVYNCSQMLYMWCKAIVNINSGKTTATYSVGTVNEPENPNGSITEDLIYLDEIIDMAERNITFIDNNGQAPNYCTTSLGTLQYEGLVYFMARTLSFYHEEGRLPTYTGTKDWTLIDTSGSSSSGSTDSGSSSSGSTATGSGATFGNDFSAYSKYLVKTAYCHCTNATIISVAKTGMKYGSTPKTTYQAMYNLFEYLNDKTSYDWYYDSSRGATGVWRDKIGNCCDMAHLMNACARSLGVPGRYVHGYCRFSSGTTTGHVWSEVYTGSKWYTADLVSDYNYLGYKTSTTLSTYGRYAELPF